MTPCKRGHTSGRYSNGTCKECTKLYPKRTAPPGREWPRRPPAQRRASYARRRKQMTVAQRMLAGARSNATQFGLPFNLTEADIVIPSHCPALGLELTFSGRSAHTDANLDRLIPELGYVRGNVHVICHLANRIKSNATPEQLRAVADWLQSVYPEWLKVA